MLPWALARHGCRKSAVAAPVVALATTPCSHRCMASVVSSPSDALKVATLIRSFRNSGHLLASVDPLAGRGTVVERERQQKARELYALRESLSLNEPLNLAVFDLGHLQDTAVIDVSNEVPYFSGPCTLRELVEVLDQAYCGNVGIEYTHIAGKAQKLWIRHRIERMRPFSIPKRDKIDVMRWLCETEAFENFLAKQFPSSKRFGLQGCDALMPALFTVIARSVELGADAVELGMAHRGRLNVLAHVMNKPLAAIFSEFGTSADIHHVGDVKYHLGTRCTIEMPRADTSFPAMESGMKLVPVELSISANPSHLEAVDPVVMGRARSVADVTMAGDVGRVLSLLVHGDASFSGQGIVAETLQLGSLPDYTVGGMVHIIVNNQIGFTTAPHRSRSSIHCTDIAKSVGAPIIHVNADDPEAVAAVAAFAAEWRSEWNTSVVVDIVGYRRQGHNEQDEPMYTQPLMYKAIAARKPVAELYAQQMEREGVLPSDRIEQIYEETLANMHAEYELATMSGRPQGEEARYEWLASSWQTDVLQMAATMDLSSLEGTPTGMDIDHLKETGKVLATIPPGFNAHKGIVRIMKERMRMAEGKIKCNWAMAEALACATLGQEGCRVRIAGQDSERGTFNHRHSALYDQATEERYVPMQKAAPEHAIRVINSSLSEAAALGFEYGYSLTSEKDLVVWEAQFGDFANTAQCLIDTFIATGEHRWYSQSSLVLMLPHGFEGQGPDHSSARMERVLQLCADDPDNVPGRSPSHVAAVETGFDVAAEGKDAIGKDELLASIQEVAGKTRPIALSPVDAERMLNRMDTSGDGIIQREEWKEFMLGWLTKEAALHANMVVIYPTTPANYFHALRRQVHRTVKKPLVIFTPKALLHHKPCASPLSDMGPHTSFLPVIGDGRDIDPAAVTRVILVTGKLYYPLRRSRDLEADTALVRVEELHPFPFMELAAQTIHKYPNLKEIVWTQEEPRNMGGWSFVAPRIATMARQLGPEGKHDVLLERFYYIGPLPQPSPTASYAIHSRGIQAVISAALTGRINSSSGVSASNYGWLLERR